MVEITPEFALSYIKYGSILVGSWPPKSCTSKSVKIMFDLWWYISLTNLIFVIVPLIYSSVNLKNDPLNSLKFLFLALNAIQCVIKMIICKCEYYQFRFLLEELQMCVNNSKPHEKRIFSKYLKDHGIIYILIMVGAVFAVISIVSGAIYQPQLLPIDAKYPFTVDFHPVIDIIYISQILNGFQVGSITVIDTQVALLLWFSVARLNILGDEIKTAKNILQLQACIQKHQYLLWLIEKIIKTTRFIILTTVIMCMLSIIFGSTHILGDNLIVKLQCISTVLVLIFILYMNAYPAEFLIHACENIGWSAWSAYDSSKCEKASEFNKCLIFMIQKSQQPSMIQFRGIVPGLSLTYYRAFLAKTFSFFTTLRVLLHNISGELNI